MRGKDLRYDPNDECKILLVFETFEDYEIQGTVNFLYQTSI